MCERGERARRQINAVAERQQPRYQNKNRDDAEKSPDAEPAGAHRRNLAVRGEAAEPNQDSQQDAHRNRVSERDWDSEEKNFGNAGKRRAVADHKLKDAAKIAGEKNKSKNRRADQGVGDDFSQDVARKDAHPQRLTQLRG